MKKKRIFKIAVLLLITGGLVALSVIYPLGSCEGFFYDDGKWSCVEVSFDSQRGAQEAIEQTATVIFYNPQTEKKEILTVDEMEIWNGKSWCIYVTLPKGKRFEDYEFKHGDTACKVVWEGGECECTYWK